MKVIFLDVDGVLNCEATFIEKQGQHHVLDDALIARCNADWSRRLHPDFWPEGRHGVYRPEPGGSWVPPRGGYQPAPGSTSSDPPRGGSALR